VHTKEVNGAHSPIQSRTHWSRCKNIPSQVCSPSLLLLPQLFSFIPNVASKSRKIGAGKVLWILFSRFESEIEKFPRKTVTAAPSAVFSVKFVLTRFRSPFILTKLPSALMLFEKEQSSNVNVKLSAVSCSLLEPRVGGLTRALARVRLDVEATDNIGVPISFRSNSSDELALDVDITVGPNDGADDKEGRSVSVGLPVPSSVGSPVRVGTVESDRRLDGENDTEGA